MRIDLFGFLMAWIALVCRENPRCATRWIRSPGRALAGCGISVYAIRLMATQSRKLRLQCIDTFQQIQRQRDARGIDLHFLCQLLCQFCAA